MRRVHDLGVELHAVDAPLDVLHGGHRRVGGRRGDHEAVRRRATIESKWLIHTCWCVGWPPPKSTPSGDDLELGPAVLAAPGAGHLAAELRATSWAP